MQYTVMVRQLTTDAYVAIAPLLPQHRGEGRTRDEAVERLQSILEAWMLEAEITTIEVVAPSQKKVTAATRHALSEQMRNPEQVLEELAGCLGQEPAADYDFDLKIGGLYEAR